MRRRTGGCGAAFEGGGGASRTKTVPGADLCAATSPQSSSPGPGPGSGSRPTARMEQLKRAPLTRGARVLEPRTEAETQGEFQAGAGDPQEPRAGDAEGGGVALLPSLEQR